MVSAFVATAFAQEDAEAAPMKRMDQAEHDVLAYMSIPREHRQKLHSTNPIERLHAEIKRRTNVVGFPNEGAITRLVGAILLEQNDEWAVGRRYMTLESIAGTVPAGPRQARRRLGTRSLPPERRLFDQVGRVAACHGHSDFI